MKHATSNDALIEVAYIGDIDSRAHRRRRPTVYTGRREDMLAEAYLIDRLFACVYMCVCDISAVANRLLKVGLRGGGVMFV